MGCKRYDLILSEKGSGNSELVPSLIFNAKVYWTKYLLSERLKQSLRPLLYVGSKIENLEKLEPQIHFQCLSCKLICGPRNIDRDSIETHSDTPHCVTAGCELKN